MDRTNLLALVFLMAGVMKIMQPKEKLADRMAWVEDFSQVNIRLIGVLEVLGGLGLILPAVTGILPFLTPLAAVGLALVMVGAARTHLRRGENNMLVMNAMLFVLAVFIAYGRFFAQPL